MKHRVVRLRRREVGIPLSQVCLSGLERSLGLANHGLELLAQGFLVRHAATPSRRAFRKKGSYRSRSRSAVLTATQAKTIPRSSSHCAASASRSRFSAVVTVSKTKRQS